MWKMFILSLGLALLACSPAPAPAPAREKPEIAPARPAAALTHAPNTLGLWQLESLSGLDDVARSNGYPVYLAVMQERLFIASQCVPFFFRATPARGGVRVSDAMPSPTPAICARTLSPVEALLPQVFLAANGMKLRAPDRLAVSGPNGEAVFVRPANPVINPFGNSPEPAPTILFGDWRVLSINGQAVEGQEPIWLVFGFGRMEVFSGCVVMARSMLLRTDRILFGPAQLDAPVCERGYSDLERALADGLSGDMAITASGPTGLRLSGQQGVIELGRD
jgi:hypothetical protein